MLYSKTSNQNVIFNKCNILIGQFCNTSTKTHTHKGFMTARLQLFPFTLHQLENVYNNSSIYNIMDSDR